jgi:hypothetical protein
VFQIDEKGSNKQTNIHKQIGFMNSEKQEIERDPNKARSALINEANNITKQFEAKEKSSAWNDYKVRKINVKNKRIQTKLTTS